MIYKLCKTGVLQLHTTKPCIKHRKELNRLRWCQITKIQRNILCHAIFRGTCHLRHGRYLLTTILHLQLCSTHDSILLASFHSLRPSISQNASTEMLRRTIMAENRRNHVAAPERDISQQNFHNNQGRCNSCLHDNPWYEGRIECSKAM